MQKVARGDKLIKLFLNTTEGFWCHEEVNLLKFIENVNVPCSNMLSESYRGRKI